MKCEKYSALMTDLLAGEISKQDESLLKEHLKSCESCEKEFKELQHAWNITRDILKEQKSTVALSPENYEKIFSVAKEQTQAKPQFRLFRPIKFSWLEMAASAVICLVVLAVLAGMLLPAHSLRIVSKLGNSAYPAKNKETWRQNTGLKEERKKLGTEQYYEPNKSEGAVASSVDVSDKKQRPSQPESAHKTVDKVFLDYNIATPVTPEPSVETKEMETGAQAGDLNVPQAFRRASKSSASTLTTPAIAGRGRSAGETAKPQSNPSDSGLVNEKIVAEQSGKANIAKDKYASYGEKSSRDMEVPRVFSEEISPAKKKTVSPMQIPEITVSKKEETAPGKTPFVEGLVDGLAKITAAPERDEIEVSMQEVDLKDIENIPEPPQPEEVQEVADQTVEIDRSSVAATDEDMAEDNTVSSSVAGPGVPKSDIVVPNVLSIKPSDSRLILPGVMAARSGGAGRRAAVRSGGGSSKTELGVEKGLRWLRDHQNADGSWGEATNRQPAFTALALLSFLAHGETPSSSEFGPCVLKALKKVKEDAEQDKTIKDTVQNGIYSYPLNTLALAEAYSMTKIPIFESTVENSVKKIIAGQNEDGSFDYKYQKENISSDIAFNGWNIQALNAAFIAGVDVPGIESALEKACKYIETLKNKETGSYKYTHNSQKEDPLSTSIAANCLSYDKDLNQEELEKTAKWLEENANSTAQIDEKDKNLLRTFMQTQAFFKIGAGSGKSWKDWNRKFTTELLKKQQQDGSWEAPADNLAESQYGKTYSTVMSLLPLQVYYRYLPTFKVPPNEVASKPESNQGLIIENDVKKEVKKISKSFNLNLKLWDLTDEQTAREFLKRKGVESVDSAEIIVDKANNKITIKAEEKNIEQLDGIFRELRDAEDRMEEFKDGLPFLGTKQKQFSTFSIDVDTASYAIARKLLKQGIKPEPETIRPEEFINFFDYHYRLPQQDATFAVYLEAAPSPFRPENYELRVGIQGKRIGAELNRPSILTILIDVSGSMARENRLDLVRNSLPKMFENLKPDDRITIIACREEPQIIANLVPANEKDILRQSLRNLRAAGTANLEKGILAAYDRAAKTYMAGASNRVILLTDGISNLGSHNPENVLKKIENCRKMGISNTVVAVGGDGDDKFLEGIANKGDGNYIFIENEEQAEQLFVDEFSARFREIARDVKIQVEFRPEIIKEYRQVGYQNRQLSKADFRNDKVDAGEVGAGQSVTALYEIKLNNKILRKQEGAARPDLMGIVRIRYRRADNMDVEEKEFFLDSTMLKNSFEQADENLRLAVCVAEFAEYLRYPDVPGIASPAAIFDKLDQLLSGSYSNDGKVKEIKELIRGVK